MMNSTISIIVPVYKVEQYLDDCVQSLVNQTYSNLEIILVDDGSPDRCPEMCDEWALRDSRIKVIHKKNGGLSDARNAGLDICTGDYIAFVDSDDWIKPDMYRRMLSAIRYKSADICACNFIRCYPDKETSWGTKRNAVGNSEDMLRRLYTDAEFPVCAWNKLYKRELWNDLRFPVGKICEDAFTTYLLVHKAERIVQIKDALYCYRIRENSIMTSEFTEKSMDEEEAWRRNYEFVKRNYPNLYRKAFSFYLQSVNVLIHRIGKDQKARFIEEYGSLKRIMTRNLFFMMFQSTVSVKYRIKYLVDLIQL